MSSKTPVDERIALLSSPKQRTASRCLPDSDDLMRELGRILESPALRRSPKLQDLLCFLVEETLAGRHGGLAAARIAERVFGKERGFKSSEDPVVRVAANRLRTALALYSFPPGFLPSPILLAIRRSILSAISRTGTLWNTFARGLRRRVFMSDVLKNAVRRQRILLEGLLASPLGRLASTCSRVWADRSALETLLSSGQKTLPSCKYLYVLDHDVRQVTANVSRTGLRIEHFGRDRKERPYLAQALAGERFSLSSSRATLWLKDDPYRFRILDIEDLADPGICLAYPRRAYPDGADLPLDRVKDVFRTFRDLRFMDETIYLRSGSLNIFNGIVGLNFSCDGSHYMPWWELLDKRLGFWLGTGEIPGG